MGIDLLRQQWIRLKKTSPRQTIRVVLTICRWFCTILIAWKFLVLVTNCAYPVIILESSQTPVYQLGDVLMSTNFDSDLSIGKNVVFHVRDRKVDIVHRVVEVQHMVNGSWNIMTKGDMNRVNDRGLYEPGQMWLSRADIDGVVQMRIPYAGIAYLIVLRFWKALLGLWLLYRLIVLFIQ